MEIPVACSLAWAPLRNTVRAVVYTRKGPGGPQTIPPARFFVRAAVAGTILFILPIVFSPAIAAALQRKGVPIAAFGALAVTVVSGLSLAYGVVAALGTSLPRALAMDELLLSLPIPTRSYVRAKLMSLGLEGGFWTMMLAYPLVLQSLVMQRASLVAHVLAIGAVLLQAAAMIGLGIALAHGFLLLRPEARRASLLVRAMMIVIVGAGLGTTAVAATSFAGGPLPASLALAQLPWSPTALPYRAIAGLVSGDAYGAASFALLAVPAIVFPLAALGLMSASHRRICFLEEQ